MKKIIMTFITGLALVTASMSTMAEIQSLRGAHALDKPSETLDKRKQIKQKDGFERSYKIQPPMIPHTTEKDRISLKNNSCMKCHSEKNHEKEKAPRIGDSHYIDRDGNKLSDLSSRRYFCTQCHATQVDADQLVENDFVGAK
ncbi:nitrate reductase cytochrome c-type subunit [Solemya velum gill symbiont]|uniref:Periplasmic nitrate reductase, electron transfer subunit n=1 Tax=Solemya velum gill symbiont TaxID=2340 RepID=A0A0B0HD36_SOVGS|nr:nitrate reductase cytochrome c-type subunit [Solemya velum gill symbiont]KHF25824.1 periplasmic nitrate reductase napFDAGHBC, subunit B [Solemya velum gill symbiont]OOY34529.1 nitrate reductase [Solemya velum gill symbiont]OOY37244.1 nitrate reductase [Solemya velum gill symbiont]OOY39762.1 nitrate reductase [Solemya velum gill symbiont]OOY47562.1 nitrate reductase [Solemya velum gill symbiont]